MAHLISSDNELFEISKAAAQLSETIVIILKEGVAGKAIPLRKVNSKTLRVVLEFCNRHAAAGDAEYPNETLEQFHDNLFQPLQIYELVNLIVAADYLGIIYLLANAICYFKCAVKGKTSEEVREHFNQNFEEHHRSITGIINWFNSTYDITTGQLLATATAEENKKFVLITSDNEVFGYPEAAAMLTECIKKVLEDGDIKGIPVPNVDPKALVKMFEFFGRYADGDETDPNDKSQKPNVLVVAVMCMLCWCEEGSDMDITKLRGLLTEAIADFTKNKSEEEVRGFFNVGE